ncbi:MAG: UDP-N-acetylmuramate dehydrogenase [Deltaproteobacteria bacterium]|nr:UDP-N-acetylmuramate dehydrogenase [Deltaproteobacteria bacterium]MBW2121803.1 UDP-N-acetylmuramate dehydrogenase [Deltaproteobacteria bacterium]
MNVLGESLKKELGRAVRGRVLFDEPMNRHTSLRIGGPADALVFPLDKADLETLVGKARQWGISYLVMGKGTNLLVRDRGVRQMVINLSTGFQGISARGERLRVEAGIPLSRMIGFAMERELSGLSPLYGIPGTVGGGIAMNAGAWGVEVGKRIESITLMDGQAGFRVVRHKDLSLRYRELCLAEGMIIVEGIFLMERSEREKIREEISTYQRRRRQTQPLDVPSAGSIFKNPPGTSAGRIIEEVGLKGKRIGGAEVSSLHANFIVNRGGATAGQMLDLIHLIQDRVLRERGIALELEVRIVGE